jgi:hypothetical protein
MRNVWIAVLSLAAAVGFAPPVAAKIPSPGNPCPAPNSTFTVDTAPEAALIADGFDCKTVDLVISNVTVTPTLETLVIEAKTIAINGPVTMDNAFNSVSDIFLRAEGGSIAITNATIRANDRLIIECKPALCTINIQSSVISAPLNPLLTTGDTRAYANGDITIENSTFFGKEKVVIESKSGTVVWHCPSGGASGCQDPLTNGVAAALCPVYPCTPTFANEAALRAVCFPGGDSVDCGGGSSECQVTAAKDVDFVGSTIVCNSHLTVTAKTGNIDLTDAVITAKDLLFFQAFKVIDATNAELTSLTASVVLETKGGTGPGVPCIILTGSTISNPNFIQPGGGCLVVP